ncbi:MAG: dihydrofolate reductase family protein [Chitinophagaceae bacterium]
MRKIVSGFAASLDGYITGANGEIDWILIDKEIDFTEEFKRYDAFFYGRITYEEVVKMGYAMPGIKNYVFSTTLKEVDKNYILVNENVEQVVKELKEQEGKDIALYGGAKLLASLLNMNLVDEISVAIIPVLLGRGKPMVNVLNKYISLELLNTKTYSNGTVRVTYNVKY